ncbi:hypothetical protein [Paenibacillus ginsengarvi]|uniref:hypothetical protein n=1 Tax=Paenibacillus ginsengarvi TaxID=400777 RepID=UPI001876E76A|nr:hypothetical protein [Paenibacillus ginsengarvi]
MMQRWLLAVTALALGIGLMIGQASESAAILQMETHTNDANALTVESSVYKSTAPALPGSVSLLAPTPFEAQVNAWIASLAAQDDFRDWQGATWTRYPLGAGMHGYLVLLRKNGNEIGYLVAGEAEDGSLKLIEYGSGPSPLFSMKTLYRSLVQSELIPSDSAETSDTATPPVPVQRLYYSPLHAVWKVPSGSEWIYIDAVTGEQLPLTSPSFEPLRAFDSAQAVPGNLPRLLRSLVQPSFDPFDNTYWITDKPLHADSAEQLSAVLESADNPVMFKANLYGRQVLAPFAVTGLHHWEGSEPYIRLEQEGLRFIPFEVLKEYGTFHQQRESRTS